MVEMSIYGVSFDLVGKQPIVLLKTAEGNRYLPIWIGHPEAASILMKLQGATAPRPLTHDLLVNILNELEGEDVDEDKVVDEFKKFLDHVSAEDFAEAEVEADDEDD